MEGRILCTLCPRACQIDDMERGYCAVGQLLVVPGLCEELLTGRRQRWLSAAQASRVLPSRLTAVTICPVSR